MGILDSNPPMPAIDVSSNEQNQFVRTWLEAFQTKHETPKYSGWGQIDSVIETVEEAYDA